METARLNYIRLLAHNYAECYRFYRDQLGLKPRFGTQEEGVYEEFRLPHITLALFRRELMAEVVGTKDKPVDADAQDRSMIIFAVDNVDETTTRLKSRGVTFVREPHDQTDWLIRAAHFRDPDGNLIEINQPLKRD